MNTSPKLNLVCEYNEQLCGFIATDTLTQRSVNYFFDFDRSETSSPFGKIHFLSYGVNGDESHTKFIQDELDAIDTFLNGDAEIDIVCSWYNRIHRDQDLIDELAAERELTGSITLHDICRISQMKILGNRTIFISSVQVA